MAIKLIVTHKSPDLDAIASIWLLKRFDEQHFGLAEVAFVNAGDEISLEELGQLNYHNYEIVHVDTGGGQFDHHNDKQANQRVSAASLVFEYLKEIHPDIDHNGCLQLLIDHVIDVDHFAEVYWPERNEIRAVFYLSEIMAQLKNIGLRDEEVVDYGLVSLDAVYARLIGYTKAAQSLNQATEFVSAWGTSIALVSANPLFITYAQRQGYALTIRKDEEYGHILIKALPDNQIDLSQIYEKITYRDPKATWYLHPSKTMLLNGSDKKRNQVASSLTLQQVIDICSA